MSETSPLVEAQQKFVATIPQRQTGNESCPLQSALDRVLVSDITAPTDMPPYHRAIVEGFVVNTSDTHNASEENPVSLTIAGEVKPGERECPAINTGQAIRVSTGSILPDGDYSIVRMWEAKVDGDQCTITRPFPPRFFIEDRGCDLKQGAVALAAGTALGPLEIGTIASLGLDNVEVACRPRVTIFASGDEVIPYTAELLPGTIRDSNSIMLASAVTAAGATATIAGIMKDDFAAFVATVKAALDTSDMILIAGGTAIGDRDFISDLVREVGELVIDGVPMKSGRPLIMGIANNKPLVCVAGHPPEALRGFHLFGTAALNKLMGRETALPADNQPSQ